MSWMSLAMAAGPEQQTAGWLTMAPMIIIFVIFYLLLIRPQQKKEQERLRMISALNKGDRVITQGGIYGTVIDVKEDRIVLEVGEKIRLNFIKSAISRKA